MLEVFKISL